MKYPKTDVIVIQTALRPMTVAYLIENEWKVEICEDFMGFFAVMQKIPLTKNTKLLVNRGPGSYTGIRTGIAYVLGLLNGGPLSKNDVYPYTSFDLIKAATKAQAESVYIKAWPRLASGTLAGSKGYYENNNKIEHVEFESIDDTKNTIIFSEEELTEKVSNKITLLTSEIFNPVDTYTKLQSLVKSNGEPEPLYINPVNITKK